MKLFKKKTPALHETTPEITQFIEMYDERNPKPNKAQREPVKTLHARVAEAKRRGFHNVLVPVELAEVIMNLHQATTKTKEDGR